MALRLRKANGRREVLAADRISFSNRLGDLYINDQWHQALTEHYLTIWSRKGLISKVDAMKVIKKKTCPKCQVVKPTSEFWKESSRSDGLGYSCKACARVYNTARKRERFNTDEEYAERVRRQNRAFQQRAREDEE